MRLPVLLLVSGVVVACGSSRAREQPRKPPPPEPDTRAKPPQSHYAEKLIRAGYLQPAARESCLDEISDQKLLADVTMQATSVDIRGAAAARLTDPGQLRRVALRSRRSVPLVVVERLDDQEALWHLANSVDSLVAEKATAKLTRQPALARLAMSSRHGKVREIAVERLRDEDLLLQVALGRGSEIPSKAASRITDQAHLARVATESTDDRPRAAATARLENQELLARIATGDKSEEVRVAAIRNLTDTETLCGIALRDRNDRESYSAIASLEDVDALRDIRARCEKPKDPDRDSRCELARLRVLLLSDGLPRTRLRVEVFGKSQRYGYHKTKSPTWYRLNGEIVRLFLSGPGGEELYRKEYATRFPEKAKLRLGGDDFRRAGVDELDFFTGLFGTWPGLDLGPIARGPADLTLRRAAVAHLEDKALLAELSREETASGQDLGAARRLRALSE